MGVVFRSVSSPVSSPNLTQPHPISPVTSFLTARARLGEVLGEETRQNHPPYMGSNALIQVLRPHTGVGYTNLTVLTG